MNTYICAGCEQEKPKPAFSFVWRKELCGHVQTCGPACYDVERARHYADHLAKVRPVKIPKLSACA